MFSSHGASTRAQHISLARQLGSVDYPCLVLLDEPDMALSPRSAYALAGALDEAGKRGHQIIGAVHNPILIASQSEVFSLEHKRWMSSAKFLSEHADAAKTAALHT